MSDRLAEGREEGTWKDDNDRGIGRRVKSRIAALLLTFRKKTCLATSVSKVTCQSRLPLGFAKCAPNPTAKQTH